MRATLLVPVLMAPLLAQQQLEPGVKPFLRVSAPVIALTHVRVIDGTGVPERADQTIVIAKGKIQASGNASDVAIPAGAERLDLATYTVIPGLVGMHEHLFYLSAGGIPLYGGHGFSFPRMYLAGGVSTERTGGGLEI